MCSQDKRQRLVGGNVSLNFSAYKLIPCTTLEFGGKGVICRGKNTEWTTMKGDRRAKRLQVRYNDSVLMLSRNSPLFIAFSFSASYPVPDGSFTSPSVFRMEAL